MSIDIVGHEAMHATIEATANLNYNREPGALNESFADIFGKSVEYYAIPDSFTWKIGEKILLNGKAPFRDLSNPNSLLQPKYYKGKYYNDTSSDDFYGIHTNCGVPNYWFYLLSQGGLGTRETDGKPFNVQKIGIDTAAIIAYYTLTNYLTPTSNFIDAATNSIAATRLLYGDSSHLVQEVINAWYAVGVLNTTTVAQKLNLIGTSFEVYPNPTSNILYVRASNKTETMRLQLFDIMGRKVQTIVNSQNSNDQTIEMHSLPAGLYVLEILVQNEKSFLKVVKN